MSQLAHLLKIFDRDDVTEVVLQSGKPASAKVGAEYRGLTKSPLTTEQIESLAAGTVLEPLLPVADGVTPPRVLSISGISFLARAARRAGALQIRLERSSVTDFAPVPTAATPAPVPAPADPAARPQRPAGRRSASGRHIAAPAPAAPAPVAAPARAAAPAVRARSGPPTLNEILRDARSRGATDAHIVAGRPSLIRVAGDLLPYGEEIPPALAAEMLLGMLTPPQRTLLDERGYVDLSAELEGTGRLRVNVARQRSGLKGSFRLVMEPLPTLESLGLPRELAKVTTYHQGLVVIAGPSGHGKTTTLAALVDLINSTKQHHILTVEEPIEFIHPRKRAVVSQREVGPHTKSFATALKASLREDPDVIVIGELRDRETVEIAMTAAETGHLVMATMSTPSAAKTIDRLIDLFPPEDQQQIRATLAGALKFIVAQRLLPATDGGVAAVVELLSGTPPLWAMIRDNKLFQLPNLQQRGRSFGIIRFDDSLLELFRAGKITEELTMRMAENRKEMELQIHPPAAPVVAPPAQMPGAQQAQKLTDVASKFGRGLFGKKELTCPPSIVISTSCSSKARRISTSPSATPR